MILPEGLPDKKWFGTLLREFQDRMGDATLADAEHIVTQVRAISDDLGRRLSKRRDEEMRDVCRICGDPFQRGLPYGTENLIDDVSGFLRPAYACSDVCLRDLQEMSKNQGRNKAGNLF